MKEKIYLQKCVLVCTNILYARKKQVYQLKNDVKENVKDDNKVKNEKCGELSHDHALNSGYLWSFYSSQHQFIGVLSENWSAKILAQIKENWKYS